MKTSKRVKRGISLVGAALLISSAAYAGDQQQINGRNYVMVASSDNERVQTGPPRPPQEAITACEGKSEGDRVAFQGPRGDTIEGTCRYMGQLLFVIPEGGPPARQHRRQ